MKIYMVYRMVYRIDFLNKKKAPIGTLVGVEIKSAGIIKLTCCDWPKSYSQNRPSINCT